MSDVEDNDVSPVVQLKLKQSRERKELQAKITSLKHSVSKNDKKRKKEVAADIEKLEQEQKDQHESELRKLEANFSETLNIFENADMKKDLTHQSGSGLVEIKEKKPTKAQQRREKKAEEIKRRAAIAAEDENNAQFSQGKIETDEIQRLLSARNLQLYDIAADGDCLYNALSHQLNKRDFSGALLRRIASKYIRENREDFQPFLVDESGNVLDEFGFAEYCHSVEKTCGEGGAWGGAIEIRAISSSLSHRIEVLQPGGQVVLFGEQFTDKKPLVVTYHRFAYKLGEHYNSTVPAENTVTVAE